MNLAEANAAHEEIKREVEAAGGSYRYSVWEIDVRIVESRAGWSRQRFPDDHVPLGRHPKWRERNHGFARPYAEETVEPEPDGTEEAPLAAE